MNSSSVIRFNLPGPSCWELDNNIHIWKFPAKEIEFSLLTASEKEIAGSFRFAGDRNRFAVGRQALRLLLSKYLSVTPEEISISAQKGQKPFISYPVCSIQFNTSHSGDWILIAFANLELGIDIEKAVPDFDYDDIVAEHFNEPEKMFVSLSDRPVSSFYYLWTRKEALTKAQGRGLRDNLKTINALDEYLNLNIKSWRLQSFEIAESYFAAIAYTGDPGEFFFYEGTGLL